MEQQVGRETRLWCRSEEMGGLPAKVQVLQRQRCAALHGTALRCADCNAAVAAPLRRHFKVLEIA